jgi:maleate isomerase
MHDRFLLGMLTPSSNTVLEPISSAMVAGTNISVHFSRFPVTEISLSQSALGQFSYAPMLAAASLLADARVQAICWNGTSAGWLGFEADRGLCRAIEEHTRIPATSSVLALADICRITGAKTLGLVTPYLDEVQRRIVATFAAEGLDCIAERHSGERVNFAFSEVAAERLTAMVRDVAVAKPDAITIFCTNLRGAGLVESLERELGLPIYDTVATAVWASLRIAGARPDTIRGWGRLFRDVS